ncbi:type II toxin-antitoxin system Phd/YefM family antitoxin [Caviibacterium pharyngocola]|uniref:Type II toxin-antitoxin system Phd/YefM family antitoxin n=1 Tax=Caviibacterium pharyngocola TaxID=28159 RepID=A0A2M8RU24_9PAST|nr:type II toxin-antitoxin system Phd/YefM family antitoxin [Caviibacterium pharyngocola]PJG82364.1 type II toxin-antitoxin system Phd/YefM family antitoxin [Caviibacterium pharyngocola]
MNTISSRDFNQNVAKAKHLADSEPVFITDRGELSYVLMNYAMYRQFHQQQKTNAQRVSMSEAEIAKIDADFEFERVEIAEREEVF